MATAATDMMLRCGFDGSLSMHDMDIEQMPYHRNCSCALHKSKGARPTACFQHGNISFPKKQLWNDCPLSIIPSKVSSQSSYVSDSSSTNREEANEVLSSR